MGNARLGERYTAQYVCGTTYFKEIMIPLQAWRLNYAISRHSKHSPTIHLKATKDTCAQIKCKNSHRETFRMLLEGTSEWLVEAALPFAVAQVWGSILKIIPNDCTQQGPAGEQQLCSLCSRRRPQKEMWSPAQTFPSQTPQALRLPLGLSPGTPIGGF